VTFVLVEAVAESIVKIIIIIINILFAPEEPILSVEEMMSIWMMDGWMDYLQFRVFSP
jgi:hypothetical protein